MRSSRELASSRSVEYPSSAIESVRGSFMSTIGYPNLRLGQFQVPMGMLGDPGEFLEQAQATALGISQSFDALWNQVLNGGLFAAVTRIGILFAVATLVWWIVQWTRQLVDGQDTPVSDLMMPIIVGAFLVNDGALLVQLILALRDYINDINSFVLQFTAAGVSIQDAYQDVNQLGSSQLLAGELLRQCEIPGLELQQQLDCLQQVADELNTLRNSLNPGSATANWFDRMGERITTAQALVQNGGGNVVEQIFGGISGTIGGYVETLVRMFLMGLNVAYQWGIEVSGIILSLCAPMAMGATLLPTGSKPIYTWFSAFLGLGITKLSFNIVLGLAATVIVNSQANQPMFFLLFIGIIAPILASVIGAMGGMSAFSALSRVANAAVGIGLGSVGGLSHTVARHYNNNLQDFRRSRARK